MTSMVDPKVSALTSPQECQIFAENAAVRGRPDLAQQARVRAVELRAAAHGAATDAEREALAAIYAYEEVLSARRGRRTRASRTWQMVTRHGLIGAVERAVNRPNVTIGYTALLEMGLHEFAFEAIVLRYPSRFSDEAVERCRRRAAEWAHE